jgi:hypothetical protein
MVAHKLLFIVHNSEGGSGISKEGYIFFSTKNMLHTLQTTDFIKPFIL